MNKLIMKDKIIKIVKQALDIETDKLDYNVPLINYGLDSIKYVLIIIEIEQEFDIIIPDDYLIYNKMSSINEILSIVHKLKSRTNNENDVIVLNKLP